MSLGRRIEELLGFWFGMKAPVDRAAYAASGLSLMALKYGIDFAVVYAVAGRIWTPLDYFSPLLTLHQSALGDRASWLLLPMAVWTLPFLWIALSMTLRRAIDARQWLWLTLLILVPGVNYLVMVWLCFAPSQPAPSDSLAARDVESVDQLRSALLGVTAGVALALAMTAISVQVWGSYGGALFFVTPTVMGAVSAYLHNRWHRRSIGSTIAVAALTTALAGGALLVFALEGAVCLLMAFPLALAATVIGAAIGWAIAARGPGAPSQVLPIVLVLPFLPPLGEIQTPSPRFEVVSTIDIDATPERVWPHVIGFSELPAPTEWLFHTGVAYPMRARIEGAGVGAVRRCEFSTGAFVEPITRWDPPRALGFDVASQPPPMEEWSPYGPIVTPHLYGYFRSVRGEFRLVPLPGGRTRLEGRTWYELDLAPRAYFALWSDALISRIHRRVLAHVKRLAEADSSPGE